MNSERSEQELRNKPNHMAGEWELYKVEETAPEGTWQLNDLQKTPSGSKIPDETDWAAFWITLVLPDWQFP